MADGNVQLVADELREVRQHLATAHDNITAATRIMLQKIRGNEDLTGLMLEFHIHLDSNVYADLLSGAKDDDEDDFIVIRSDLRPVGVYVDPPGICYPITQ